MLTSGDFCVAVSQQKVLAQPCSGKDDQLFEWDLGELRLQELCLQAKNDSEVMLAPCDGQAQWEWQKDRLFNSKVSRCLDVAGRRHTPARRCGWPNATVERTRASAGSGPIPGWKH